MIRAKGGLANAGELARRYSISRQAMHEQAATAGFPKPIRTVDGRPLWLAAEVDEWRASRALYPKGERNADR